MQSGLTSHVRLLAALGYALLGAVACDRSPVPADHVGPRAEPNQTAHPSAGSSHQQGRHVERLNSVTHATPERDVPRVFALSRNVWVRSAPSSEVQWIGSLWMGASVKIRGSERSLGAGCGGEWTPVEPRGWVCVDGARATTDPNDSTLLALYPFRPRTETPWPHRYALVHKYISRYDVSPVAAELTGATATSDPFPMLQSELPALPPGLGEGRMHMAARSALAYAGLAKRGDEDFLLAPDLSWIRRKDVELMPQTEFEGVSLRGAVRLPLAFFRGRERPAYRRAADGSFGEASSHFARLSHVLLSGKMVHVDQEVFHEVEGGDLWLKAREAVIPRPGNRTPWSATVGATDERGRAPSGRATWLEVSVLEGWLLAFEGTTPVYATMISAGRGGTPVSGKEPVSTASTPTGRFTITGKFKTATMESSSTPIIHADVPWTQNFSGPHAIHSAYWHDDWGSLKSAGCVNVSPRDGKWLFEFTEPQVPDGWHGVKYLSRYGDATTVLLHE